MIKDDMMRVVFCVYNDLLNLSKNEGKVIEINLFIIYFFFFVMLFFVVIVRSCY